MSKIGRGICITLGILVALGAVMVLGANMYLQSQLSREKIERRLGQVLHMPVKAERITFTPWKGLEVIGVKSPQQDREGDFFEAGRFAAKLRLFPLLRGKLSIAEMTLDQPKVVWYQTNKGRWRLPKFEEEKVGPSEPEKVKPEKPPREKPERPKRAADVEVGLASLSDGHFHFLDKRGNRVFAFDGVQANSGNPRRENLRGDARIASLSIRDLCFFQDIQTSFKYENGEVELPDLKGSIAGGSVEGNMKIATRESGSPYRTQTSFKGVDVARLLAEGGVPLIQMNGLITGELEMKGETDDRESITGKGHIQCDGGRIQQMELLSQLGALLRIDELSVFELQKAYADFRIDDGKVYVDSLVLQSTNLRLTGKGKVKLNGKMDLDAQLTINDKIARQLPGFVKDKFATVDTNQHQLDFDIKGTLEKPKSNFMEQLGLHNIERQAGDLIKSIFGHAKKPKETESKNTEAKSRKMNELPAAASPAPAPSNDGALHSASPAPSETL